MRFGPDKPLKLDAGVDLAPFQIAYMTYGKLNAERSNAILICHALTGDQHVIGDASRHRQARLVGNHGRPRQADRHRPLLRHLPERARRLHGHDRPGFEKSRRPASPMGFRLPVVTIRDMVRAQAMLLDHLGIEKLLCVTGGSMGGDAGAAMGGELSRARVRGAPDRVRGAPLGAEHRLPRSRPPGGDGRSRLAAAAIIFVEGTFPRRGLAVARMAAHITYLSDAALHRKFGRELQDRDAPTFGFDADFQVESYLRHQGSIFVERFDANSYLYITRAMDYFDLAADHGGVLAQRLQGHQDALLPRLVHLRLAVPDGGSAPDRACAERRRALRFPSPRS